MVGTDPLEQLRDAVAAIASADAAAAVAEGIADGRARLRALVADWYTAAGAAASLAGLGVTSSGDLGSSLSRAPKPTPVPSGGGLPPGEPTAEERLMYVYGVVPAAVADPIAGIPGIETAPVDVVVLGEIAAVVSPLRANSPWTSPDTWPSLEEDDIRHAAQMHEGVLESALARGSVVPFRLGTVARSAHDVRCLLASHGPLLADIIERVTGAAEWTLTFTCASEDPEPAMTGQLPPAGPGAGYLRQRQGAIERAEATAQFRADLAAKLHDEVARRARDAVCLRIGGGREERDLLYRGSYLVERDDEEAFLGHVDRCLAGIPDPCAVRGHVTGPWPAYHFVGDAAAIGAGR